MPAPEGTFACDPALAPSTEARLRRLTAAQWSNTIASLGVMPAAAGRVNPFDDGLASGKFSSDVTRVGLPVESLSLLLDAAESLAKELAPKLRAETACLAAAAPAATCIDELVKGFGAKVFRRPLSAEEITRYGDFIRREVPAEGVIGALELGLSALLSSPHFVFRFEQGGAPDGRGQRRLTAVELASAVAYTLTDAPPDAALSAAAAAGKLDTPAGLRAEVTRLLAGAQTPAVARFFRESFRYGAAARVFKDPAAYPFHKGGLLVDDTDLFVRQALAQKKGFLEALLAAPAAMVRAETAGSYGVASAPAAPAMTALPAGQRAGLLTQPSFLVAFSGADNTLPVHRGRFISEQLLCRPVPDLPLSAVTALPAMPDATVRERLAAHTTQPECAACHDSMDPFGLALEQYDHVGRFRTKGEGGKPIDASGVLTGAGAVDGPFAGPAELGGKLARSPVVRQCFVLQAFRYWMGRDEQAADGCTLKAADEAFSRSGGDAIELFVTLLTSDAFLSRHNGSGQ